MELLQNIVLIAAGWCLAAMASLYTSVKTYGSRASFSAAAGDPAQGVRYAFTKGMLPWAKESIRENPVSYAIGITFHLGVFVALALLAMHLLGIWLPWGVVRILCLVAMTGGVAGLVLFVKRMVSAHLRGLSSPDDFISNLLSSVFALLAALGGFFPPLQGAWLVIAAILLAYVPFGKIRHCLFFFTTRRHLGTFFGRRGTFPPGGDSHA